MDLLIIFLILCLMVSCFALGFAFCKYGYEQGWHLDYGEENEKD